MRKIITLILLFVCSVTMYGQAEFEMRGVEGINPYVLNKIIEKHTKKIKLRSVSDDPMEMTAINLFHEDFDTGIEMPKSANGRVIVHKTIGGVSSPSSRPLQTPYSYLYSEDLIVTDVTESVPPVGYKPYSMRLVVYLNANLDVTLMEANAPIKHNNTDKKYMCVYFLSEKM
ncbi:hypothetical protein CLV62_1453 [Dysgonomonas alginatilytica]|uniref:Uncharacterized protein n=1 Tax=Dysgonomonas alginatilytica TaxID=1605892 RepID=A0A2V3PIK6_9BACT|nr:hypothetical protein [Dysgonomonas alginatilytica]PXV58480.1 hypothetical protein CLV62_1453 [Dysgonomonas alginatilytica]